MKQASRETRERALAAYKKGVPINDICRSLGICRKTFYFWRKREAEGGEQIPKPKGHRPPALSAEDLERIRKLYQADNSLYAREISEKLGLNCHKTIIYRALKKLGFTFKKSLVATEREREDVKAARDAWAIWQKDMDPGKLVFLDESGIRTNSTINHGWAPKGQRCIGKAPCGWESYSLLSAISQNEIVEGIVMEGGLNKPTFKYFMEELLLPRLERGTVVIMDNLKVHKNSFNIRRFNRKGIKIIYLPPYSPDLNPIENMWSKVKEIIKKLNPRDLLEIWRAMNSAFFTITSSNLAGWFKHCGYYH